MKRVPTLAVLAILCLQAASVLADGELTIRTDNQYYIQKLISIPAGSTSVDLFVLDGDDANSAALHMFVTLTAAGPSGGGTVIIAWNTDRGTGQLESILQVGTVIPSWGVSTTPAGDVLLRSPTGTATSLGVRVDLLSDQPVKITELYRPN